jgi:hypothetical protein
MRGEHRRREECEHGCFSHAVYFTIFPATMERQQNWPLMWQGRPSRRIGGKFSILNSQFPIPITLLGCRS